MLNMKRRAPKICLVLLATLSSFRDRPLADALVVFGEVGLSGEIRPVPNGQDRLREAAKHGFVLNHHSLRLYGLCPRCRK